MTLPVSHKNALQVNKLGQDKEGLQKSKWTSRAGVANLTPRKRGRGRMASSLTKCLLPQLEKFPTRERGLALAQIQGDPEMEAQERTVALGQRGHIDLGNPVRL